MYAPERGLYGCRHCHEGQKLKYIKEGSVVKLVVCGPGPQRAEKLVTVSKVVGREAFIPGFTAPFSKDTGICKVKLVKGMLVMLEPDSDD
jgi:hypothetical protein